MADIGMDLYLAYEDGYKNGKAETEAYLLHCGDVTPVTNADRIRAMTDEELAEFLEDVNMATCSYIMKKAPCDAENCPCWLDWLNREVDDEHTD